MPEIVTPDLTGQANKYLKVNAEETAYEFGTPGAGPGAVNYGDIGGTLSDQTDLQTALDGKANALGADDNYVTDAEKTKLSNLSGTNTGDQDLSGKSNVGHGHAISDVTGLQAALDGKAPSLGADDNYVTDAEKVVIGNTSGTNSGDNAVNTLYSGLAASKQDVLTNGYGLSGTTTKAVALTSSSAFATAETTISTATYADIAGASISLAAGTWMVIGQVNARAVNAIIQCFVAITDGANAVVSEIAMSRPASGTASLNSPISCNVVAIVSPVGTTTYKLRGARGLTTHTGSWIAMDGNGVNTTNHASNNTDKGTGIFAIRIS